MLVFWGTKRLEKKLGSVADFCPLCREVRVCDLYRIGLATHIYYIAVGEGKLGGHLLRCTVCHTPYSADPRRYAAVETRASRDLAALEELTFPHLRESYAERLAIEQRLQRSSSALSTDERACFILEPFRLTNLEVEMRYSRETEFDRASSLGCAGTFLLAGGLLALGILLPYPRGDAFLLAAGAALSVGAIYTLAQLGFAPSRYMRHRIAPLIASALAPLEPRREELQACLLLCRGMGLKIGHKLKLPVLWKEIERRTMRHVR